MAGGRSIKPIAVTRRFSSGAPRAAPCIEALVLLQALVFRRELLRMFERVLVRIAL